MNSAPPLMAPYRVICEGPVSARQHRTAHRMTEAASLNRREHQPSKLRGAGSSPAAVARGSHQVAAAFWPVTISWSLARVDGAVSAGSSVKGKNAAPAISASGCFGLKDYALVP